MFLMICRIDNRIPKDENIIGSFCELSDAKAALRKECKDKREYLMYEGELIGMFASESESWVIEIWKESVYNRRTAS